MDQSVFRIASKVTGKLIAGTGHTICEWDKGKNKEWVKVISLWSVWSAHYNEIGIHSVVRLPRKFRTLSIGTQIQTIRTQFVSVYTRPVGRFVAVLTFQWRSKQGDIMGPALRTPPWSEYSVLSGNVSEVVATFSAFMELIKKPWKYSVGINALAREITLFHFNCSFFRSALIGYFK